MRFKTVKPNNEIIEQLMKLDARERITTLTYLYKQMSAEELRENCVIATCHYDRAEKKIRKQSGSYIEYAETGRKGFKLVKYS